jgi:hypothetical protein
MTRRPFKNTHQH